MTGGTGRIWLTLKVDCGLIRRGSGEGVGMKDSSTDLMKDDSWKQYWRRSHHENHSRMRLKLNLTLDYNSHTDASNLRDNTGWLSRVQSADGMPLPGLAKAAANQGDPEDEFPFIEDEMRTIPSESPTNQPHSDTREKLILAQDCELVTLMSAIKGRFELTNTHFYFHEIPSSSSSSSTERHDFVWPLNRLREVHLRRYNLRRSALEIFLTNQQNYFLNFTTKTRAKVLSRLASLRPPNLIFTSSRSPAELLRASGLIQKWVHREISNFDYLMHLNTLAGRTYNDLSQYPVCPWILADYTSDHLDLDSPKTFRDLSKPIGVVNPKNEAEVRAKFDNFEDPSGTIAKFHYGTHYSNSAGVLHYLVRLEPYTSLHIELQSGRFDVADRQFHSVAQTWRLLMDNPNDVKELTPEFFYMPEFLKNHNKFDLGLLQGTRDRVNDVILPPWAKNPEDFIEQHRRALESEYVSSQLHHWIDLIFGYKQKGVGAVEALNVFYYCSYEGAVDLDSIEDAIEREAVEGMINNFGQTPSQLLREAHPRRLTRTEVLAKIIKGEYPRPDLTQYLDLISHNLYEVTSDKDPVIFVSVTRSADRRGESLVTITRNGFVTVNPWPEINVSIANKARRGASVISSWHPSLVSRPPSSAFAVSADGRFLLTGGHWDYSLRVHSLAKGRTVHIARRHHDLIICVSADPCGWYLATGSRDLTIVIWDASTLGVSSPRPLRTFHGHQAPITCIALSAELDVLVSGSEDGTVNVYGLESGELCHILQPHGLSSSGPTRVTHVSLSYHGYISFAAAHEHSTGAQHTINVFTLNGTSLGAKLVAARVTSLVSIGERLAVVDDAGDLTISTLHGLHPAHNEPCHVPAHYVAAAPGNAALVIALGDGSLAILAVKQPSKSGGAI